jgi:hypothetical protein
MTRRINYEDNIFYLKLILKQLQSGLKLSIDSALYAEKIAADIAFLDKTVGGILHSLETNLMLLDRLELLKDLEGFARLFAQFLDEVLTNESGLLSEIADHVHAFQQIKERRLEDSRRIREIINGSGSGEVEADQIVSEEEFKFLLSQDEEG